MIIYKTMCLVFMIVFSVNVVLNAAVLHVGLISLRGSLGADFCEVLLRRQDP